MVTKHYTRAVNSIYDDLFPTLAPAAQAVYSQLYRLSYGHQRRTCKISLPRLAERCNMGLTATRDAAKVLEKRGLVRRLSVDNDGTVKADRGIVWTVELPETTPSDSVGALESGPRAKSGAGPESAHMKERKKDMHERPAAVAPADVLSILKREATEYRAHYPHANDDVVRARLQAFVKDHSWRVDEALIEEALNGMMP